MFRRDMEAIFELVVTFVTLLVELTVQAVVFLFMLVMATFDPGARRKLKEQWDRSIWQRVSMVSLGVVYAGVVVFVVVMWVRFSGGGAEVVEGEDRKRETESGVKKGEVIEKLLDKAGSVIRRRQDERKRETEGGAESGEGR